MADKIIILDFGSQYSQLITRKVREHKVFSELISYDSPPPSMPDKDLKGIILSGGPSSVHDRNAPRIDAGWFELGVPVLGICYGLQLIVDMQSGTVRQSKHREYGPATLSLRSRGKSVSTLLQGLPKTSKVWMSHGDSVVKLPTGFKQTASTNSLKYAVIENRDRKIYAVQFHPEVAHTDFGSQILANFLFDICGSKANWTPTSFIKTQVNSLKEQLGKNKVICALSGGVDSSVTAFLLHKAVEKNLICIFINNGLLRLDEAKQVKKSFRQLRLGFF